MRNKCIMLTIAVLSVMLPTGAGAQLIQAGPSGQVSGQALVLQQWRKAANRNVCAPVFFGSDRDAGGKPRPALFEGGWAVAFDLPGQRNAYGIAGTGLISDDGDSVANKRTKLQTEWPRFRDLPGPGRDSFAGYGLEGATPWPADNPDGVGLDSLAYVHIGGQRCLYNVWSRLGRRHLEHLLDNLRLVPHR